MSFFLANYSCLCLLSSHVHGRRQRSQPDATVRIICERLCCVTFGFFALGSETFEFEAAATAIMAAVNAILPGSSTEIVLVGYSLGARFALYLSSHFGDRFQMVVSISGSPGIAGEVQRLLLHATHCGRTQNALLEVLVILHAWVGLLDLHSSVNKASQGAIFRYIPHGFKVDQCCQV